MSKSKTKDLIIKNEKTGCWDWMACKDSCGYGSLYIKKIKKQIKAHRFLYMLFIKKDLNGLHVLHHCDRPSCVNPGHLWIGTHQENHIDCVIKRRHGNTKKTHCVRGHKLSGVNLRIVYGNKRQCKTCTAAASRRSYIRSKNGRINSSSR